MYGPTYSAYAISKPRALWSVEYTLTNLSNEEGRILVELKKMARAAHARCFYETPRMAQD